MGLTKAQQVLVTRARTASSGEAGIPQSDNVCAYLVARIIHDLDLLAHFPEIDGDIPAFFGKQPVNELQLAGTNFITLLEKLLRYVPDADTYFYCLAVLHKARLKYERILQTQPFPTLEQVVPRGLLQYGTLSARTLVSFLIWRKWLFDIDNRAGQETGYVFEPIIAYAIGGVPYGAKRSPIKRGGNSMAGRQVDCIRDQKAYEIKLRVTMAASGQGRWSEELNFPNDCRASGYTPVLIVLDSTPSAKLTELENAFLAALGETYVGQRAWDHLTETAGATMAHFLQRYVHEPMESLLQSAHPQLSHFAFEVDANRLIMTIHDEVLIIPRFPTPREDEI